MKQWDTTNVVGWLESPEGEKWSREFHTSDDHFSYQLMTVKDDESDVPLGIAAVLWYAV